MAWRIWYPDGTTISSQDCSPFTIERRGDIQVITQSSKTHNWKTLSGKDYYMWDDRGGGARWFGGNITGLHLYLLKPGFKCVLFGWEIEDDKFDEIFDLARKDILFPQPKEIFAVGERHPSG